jgi:hypothetical protein
VSSTSGSAGDPSGRTLRHPGRRALCSGQPITYLGDAVPQLATVLLDTDHGSELLDAPAHLEQYRSVLDRFESYALRPSASRDLIHGIAQHLREEAPHVRR